MMSTFRTSETVNYCKLFCYYFFFFCFVAVVQFHVDHTMFYIFKRLSDSINVSYFR